MASEATTFITDLFGAEAPGSLLVALWRKADKTTHYIKSAAHSEAFAGEPNIYIHASLVPRDLGQSKRLTADQSSGIPGVWADIDVPGPEDPPDKRPAPHVDAAFELANAVLAPTVIVNSGYGLQAWWLFEEPWIFDNVEEREQGARISRGWQVILRQNAQQRGFSLDSTHDLTRLMRLPGTVNAKGGAQMPVELVEDDGPRYAFEEIAERSIAAAPRLPEQRPVQLTLGTDFPLRKFEALKEESDTFRKTWEHRRRDTASEGWSMSHWDLSIASQAIHAGWSDEETASLVTQHRRKYNGEGDEKANRRDYLERTIAKAHSDMQREQRAEIQEQALEELAQAAHTGAGADKRMALFNTVLSGGVEGAPVVKELIQYSDDPDDARYVFVLVDGREINVGKYENLRQPRRLDGRLGPATQFVMETVKDNENWRLALRALLEVCQVRKPESEEPVLDWVRRFTEDRLGAERNVACRSGEPFEEDGMVYVKVTKLADYIRTVLRLGRADADLNPLLKRAGFEYQRVRFQRKSGDDTEASYWRIKRKELDV